MKKTKKMFAGAFYLLKGLSSANTSFIEDKQEAYKFIEECNKRLSGFAIIHDYLLTKDGWLLIVSLLDEKTIKHNYKLRWKRSNRAKKENFLTEVWKIISEQIRQVRFTFVLYSNRKNGREGSKVKKSYERYWFENYTEANVYLVKMKKQLLKLCQRRKTYRSKKKHFRIRKEHGKGAIFLCSLNRTEESVGEDTRLFRDVFVAIGANVLRQSVIATAKLHKTPKSQIFHPKIE